ncbi:MAG: VCBS domain-containing protein [Afipia sp.]|nr:VCBS domain-containing protein [Afipia sp.]
MNFAGPFDSEFSHDSPVSLGGERFAFDSKPGFVQHHASDSHVVVPDAHLLFSGDYTRIGSDLIISGNNQKFVVGNYFKGETRPALSTKDGATLGGHIVDALTGHVHYAQATAAPAAGAVIGTVLKMSGSASVIRNGVSVELQIGAAVQKGDVVQTGSNSSIGMTFVDGSAFGMTSNARMVLNEMIFDPNGSSNSSLMSLVQGTVTFVAGQTAKNGNMRVETPVATMGIRGTAVLVEIGANDGPTKFSVLVEPDGHTGSYNLYDKVTGQLIGTVSQAGQVTFVSSLGIGQPPTAIEQLKTLADQQAEKAIIQQVFQLYFPNYNPDDSNPKLPKFGSNTSGNNLAEILFTTNSGNKQTFLTQIELRFAVTDPLTGITTYQNRIFYNTKAQFSASSILSEQTFVSTVESFKISDLVHIDDPDIGNAPFYDTATPFVAGSAIIKSAVSTNPNLSAGFLSQFLHIDQNTGVITFDRLGFNFLGDGESVTFMIQVTSRSGPDVANVIIPITITGDNDVPNDNGAPTIVLSLSDIVGAVKEDTLVTADHAIVKNGTITFRDVDLSDGHQAGVVFTSSTSGSTLNPTSNPSLPGFGPNAHIGTFTIGPVVENEADTINTGTVGWHFTLDDNDPTLQSLAEGQTITQVYTVTITDEHGALVTQTVTITITGTNDAPVIDAIAATSLNEQTDTSALTLASPIHVTFGDVDLSDVGHTALITAVTTTGVTTGLSLTPAQLIALVTPIATAKAAGSSTGSVDLGFSAPSTAFNYLASGETIKLTYTVTVSDGDGGTAPATFDVTITGTNDAPVIDAIAATSLNEQTDTNALTLASPIHVTFGDVDLSDVGHTALITAVTTAGVTTGLSLTPAQLIALVTPITTAKAAGAANGSVDLGFSAPSTAFDYLAYGETITLTYTVTVSDGDGGTTPATFDITITGTNDAPTLASVTTPTLVDTAAADTFATLNGALVGNDVDHGETSGLTYAVLNGATYVSAVAVAGSYGSLTVNSDGTYSYVPNAAAINALNAGNYTDTFTVQTTDAHGASGTATFTVNITGANDTPTVSAALSDTASEGGPAFTNNLLLNATDADQGDMLSVANVSYKVGAGIASGTAPAGISLSGNTLSVNPADPSFNHLAVGAHTTIEVSYDVKDALGLTVHQTETITINGTNDTPTVAAALTDTASEGAAAFTKNLLLGASDLDDGETATLHVTDVTYKVDSGATSSTIPAGLSLGADGHTLTIDPTNATFNHLAVGQHTTIKVSYDVTDAQGATVNQTETITINGTNDAPVISTANITLTPQGSGATKVSGLSVSDVDDGGSGQFTLTTTADHGSIAPHISTGSISAINSALQNDMVYTPTDNSPIGHGTLTVTDNQGAFDVVNFVFRQSGSSPLVLAENANQKDVLIGGSGMDQFVFTAHSGQDTVLNFTHGTDKIDFQAISSIDASALTALLAQADHTGGNTLLHLNGTTDTLLLKGVTALNASDFILHA